MASRWPQDGLITFLVARNLTASSGARVPVRCRPVGGFMTPRGPGPTARDRRLLQGFGIWPLLSVAI